MLQKKCFNRIQNRKILFSVYPPLKMKEKIQFSHFVSHGCLFVIIDKINSFFEKEVMGSNFACKECESHDY